MKACRALVGPTSEVSMRRQCELLGVSRSSLYYEPVEPDTEELALMGRLDELRLGHACLGGRLMTPTLKAEGLEVNRKRDPTADAGNGARERRAQAEHEQAVVRASRIPVFTEESEGLPHQSGVGSDITYLPMARGFLFLVAIIDLCSRRGWPGTCPARWRRDSASRPSA